LLCSKFRPKVKPPLVNVACDFGLPINRPQCPSWYKPTFAFGINRNSHPPPECSDCVSLEPSLELVVFPLRVSPPCIGSIPPSNPAFFLRWCSSSSHTRRQKLMAIGS
jgi:hypothetical protein